jgi:hypothetical protein
MTTDWAKVGRKAKRKGKTYERRCAKLLTEWTGVNFRKTPGSGGFNKQGGVVIREELFCGDLICDRSDFKFCVEAKNRQEFNFNAILKNPNTAAFTKWWWQCNDDAARMSLMPILFFKPNNVDDFIALDFSALSMFGYTGRRFMLDCYGSPVTFTMTTKDKKKETITAKLSIPFIINWKEFAAEVDPSIAFRG